MKMNSLLCLVEDLISWNYNHNKIDITRGRHHQNRFFLDLSLYMYVLYVCENSDCKNYYRTAHYDILCSYGNFLQQNLSVLWLLRPIKWRHNCKTILVVYWVLDIIGFILFPSVQCSMKWTCPFTWYAVVEWYEAGLCDREVAGSTPARGCCVPTPTQRAIPPGSVNE